MPAEPPAPDDGINSFVKTGTLALAVGTLEMAIISLVCGVLGKTEVEIGIGTNGGWCRKLNEVAPASWSNTERKDLAKRLQEIRRLYQRRDRLIHAALGVIRDGSIAGVPAGSVIDLRTFGLGYTSRKGNTWTIEVLGERLHLHEIDQLIADVHQARLGLIPHMQLVDQVNRPRQALPGATAWKTALNVPFAND